MSIDVFRKWKEEGLGVRWQGAFDKYAFSSFGHILSVDEKELRIGAKDLSSELVIRLNDVLYFHYGDSRTVTGEEKKYQECIVAFFTDVPQDGDADTIALAALDPAFKHD